MQCLSYSHFFSKKFQHICVSLDVNFNESLTNDVVSFEQLDPEILIMHHVGLVQNLQTKYGKYPKIVQKVPGKMANANSADPDQTAPEEGPHYLPIHQVF